MHTAILIFSSGVQIEETLRSMLGEQIRDAVM
jgi:hypothetical protein